MTPTLLGRIQTRLVATIAVGGAWVALVGWLFPAPDDLSVGQVYVALYVALIVVAVLGVAWELGYHGLQQLRWEKDWPTGLGLVTAVSEGAVAYLVLDAGLPIDVRPGGPNGPGSFPLATFLWMFATTWIVVWAFVNGPIQILALRWRYRGGRFDPRW